MSIAGTSSSGSKQQRARIQDGMQRVNEAIETRAEPRRRVAERPARALPPFGEIRQSARDRLQIWVWQRIMARIARVSDEVQAHKLPDERDVLRVIPAERRYPGLVGTPLIFAEQTPQSERHSPLEVAIIRFTMWLKEWYAMGDDLTQRYTAVGAPYPRIFERLQPRPHIPQDFLRDDKLAGVASRGPFSLQTQKTGTDQFEINLSALEYLEPRAPFIAAGGVARFVKDGADSLQTTEIEFRGQKTQPGMPGWTLAERRFLTGLNTNTTVVEHLVMLHIATAGTWGIVARMAFSTRHPLRVLLQPFTEETNRVNNYNIDGLILSEHSNVPIYTGYSLEVASRVIRDAGRTFDVRQMDPELRAGRQGQLDDPAFPTVQSVVDVYRIFRRFTQVWCQSYLRPELDLETRIFCQELDYRVPNGVRRLLQIERWDELTIDHVAHLMAVGAFAASVGHHIVNNMTRDYLMSFHLMPPAIDADGYPTLGVVLEKQSSIFTAGILRYKLLADAVLPDETGRRLWSQFQDELKQYEAALDVGPGLSPFFVQPSRVPSSIHA